MFIDHLLYAGCGPRGWGYKCSGYFSVFILLTLCKIRQSWSFFFFFLSYILIPSPNPASASLKPWLSLLPTHRLLLFDFLPFFILKCWFVPESPFLLCLTLLIIISSPISSNAISKLMELKFMSLVTKANLYNHLLPGTSTLMSKMHLKHHTFKRERLISILPLSPYLGIKPHSFDSLPTSVNGAAVHSIALSNETSLLSFPHRPSSKIPATPFNFTYKTSPDLPMSPCHFTILIPGWSHSFLKYINSSDLISLSLSAQEDNLKEMLMRSCKLIV